jgi:hypothetical protein
MPKFFSFVEMWGYYAVLRNDRIPESDSAAIGLGGGSATTTLGSGARVILSRYHPAGDKDQSASADGTSGRPTNRRALHAYVFS